MNEKITTARDFYFERGGPESIELTPPEKEAAYLKAKQAELGDAFWVFFSEYTMKKIEAATQTGSKKKRGK